MSSVEELLRFSMFLVAGKSMTIKVAIAGARGRMGSAAVEAIMETEGMEIVAALDYKNEGLFLHEK